VLTSNYLFDAVSNLATSQLKQDWCNVWWIVSCKSIWCECLY